MSEMTPETPPEPVPLLNLDDAIADMLRYELGIGPVCLSRDCDCCP